jgi:hypothetical protein
LNNLNIKKNLKGQTHINQNDNMRRQQQPSGNSKGRGGVSKSKKYSHDSVDSSLNTSDEYAHFKRTLNSVEQSFSSVNLNDHHKNTGKQQQTKGARRQQIMQNSMDSSRRSSPNDDEDQQQQRRARKQSQQRRRRQRVNSGTRQKKLAQSKSGVTTRSMKNNNNNNNNSSLDYSSSDLRHHLNRINRGINTRSASGT